MKATAQTLQQIERALGKLAAKYPADTENSVFTDLHLQVKPDSGELLIYNDEDEELTRCVVEQWIGNTDETFYADVVPVLRQCLNAKKCMIDGLPILKPYAFVLVDEERETISDLYLVDDDTQILAGELLKGLDRELDDFLKQLLAD